MIWIRADAGKVMGTGHVMRCLSIAEKIAERGEQVCFLAADQETVDFLASKGVQHAEDLDETVLNDLAGRAACGRESGLTGQPGRIICRCLGTDYRNMEAELPLLLPILKKNPGPILVDSYFTTPEYLETLRQETFVAMPDEDHRFPYPVDLIINYNIFGENMTYGVYPEEAQVKCLLGPAYAPLRPQFQKVDYAVRPEVERIMLTTGGADKYNLAGKILNELVTVDGMQEMEITVISGAMNTFYGELEAIAARYPQVHLYRNVSDMVSLMKECDLAITAGGSTVYELCAVGVPFLCFSFVDNQERIVRGFTERQITAFGGDYLKQGRDMIIETVKAVQELVKHPKARKMYSTRQRSLVDGQGADRIAEEIMKCVQQRAFIKK